MVRASDAALHIVWREKEAGGEAMVAETDAAVAESVEAGIRQVIERWGRLDIVFANAGINGTWTTIEDLSVEDWDETLGINLRGTFLTLKYAVPYLKRHI